VHSCRFDRSARFAQILGKRHSGRRNVTLPSSTQLKCHSRLLMRLIDRDIHIPVTNEPAVHGRRRKMNNRTRFMSNLYARGASPVRWIRLHKTVCIEIEFRFEPRPQVFILKPPSDTVSFGQQRIALRHCHDGEVRQSDKRHLQFLRNIGCPSEASDWQGIRGWRTHEVNIDASAKVRPRDPVRAPGSVSFIQNELPSVARALKRKHAVCKLPTAVTHYLVLQSGLMRI
jgi:hypothetical protein